MTFLFPGVPIVVGVVALYLVGRGCGAPNEAVRKMKAGLGHGRFLLGAGVVEQVYFSLIPGVFNTDYAMAMAFAISTRSIPETN
jgi:hypothetical protein